MKRVLVVLICLLCVVSGVQAQDTEECNGLTPVGLVVGQDARVAAGTANNNVRDIPSAGGTLVGRIAGNTRVKVLAGPRCVDGLVWWQVNYQGLIGWTVDRIEGQQRLSLAAPETPALSTTVITPENAGQIEKLRTLACENGNDFSPLIAWSTNYYAQPCSSANGRRIEILDVATGQGLLTISAQGVDVLPLAFVDDTTLLWIAAEEWYTDYSAEITALHLTNVLTGEEVASAIDKGWHSSFFWPIFFANKTRFALLKYTEPAYTVEIWNALTLEIVETYPLVAVPEAAIADQFLINYAMSEDGKQIAVLWTDPSEDGGHIMLYNLETSEPPVLINVTGQLETIGADMAFSPSGNFILFASCAMRDPEQVGFFCKGASIVWFTTKEGEAVTRWQPPFEDIGPMKFNAGGLLVMSAPFDSVLYDVDTGEVVRLFEGHSPVAMFNAEGTLLLTHGDAGTFIWGIPTP